MVNIKSKIHYEHGFRKIVILVLIIILIISVIATTTLYIKNSVLEKKEAKEEPLITEETNIFDNLPSEPPSLPPE